MKLCFALFLAVFFSPSLVVQAQPVLSFPELQAMLASGKTVRISIYYSKCKPVLSGKKVEKPSEVVSGFTAGSFELVPKSSGKGNKDAIILSNFMLNEAASGKGFVYDLVKLSVFDDGKILISTHSISPLTFEGELHEQYETGMYQGEEENAGVYFYATD